MPNWESQNPQSAAPQPHDATLPGILEQLDNQISNAMKLLENSRNIADAIHGGVPAAVEKRPDPPDGGPLMLQFQTRVSRLDHVLDLLGAQITRINRAL